MNKDYEDLFNSIGIDKLEEREIILDFLRHLASIGIKNKKIKTVEYD